MQKDTQLDKLKELEEIIAALKMFLLIGIYFHISKEMKL